jgi:hypothetical protein
MTLSALSSRSPAFNTNSRNPGLPDIMAENDIPTLWANAVRNVTSKDLDRLHTERGYTVEFCRWLLGEGLIGIFIRWDRHWAFPNCDTEGRIVSIHYRLENARWIYYPNGQETHPFVIRDSGALTSCHEFESQWDAFAVMDRLELYKSSGWMVISTRGAENGALVGNVEVPKDVPVFIWAQEDSELEAHRNKAPEDRPSERWINDVKAKHNSTHSLTVLRPLEGFKDWNELTMNGITAEQIKEIIAKAREEAETESGRHQYDTYTQEVPSDFDDEAEQEPSKPFPTHCLPPILSCMAEATAESTNVHINLPSVASISVVSASIGKGVYVQSGPDQRSRGNLFIFASAASGTGKSEGTRPLMIPLKAFEEEKLAYFNEITLPELISEQRLANKRLPKLEQRLCGKREKGEVEVLDEKTLVKLHKEHKALVARLAEIDEKLVPPTITAEDITQEAAAMLLSKNNEQLFMFSADAGKVVSNLEGLYNKLSVPDDNFYVKGYSGDPFVVNRVSRPPIHLRNRCVSLFWLLQPDLLERMLEHRRLRDGGFIARPLICDTDLVPTELRRDARSIPKPVFDDYDRLIRDLLNFYWYSRDEREIKVTTEALECFFAFHDELVPRRKSDLADINSFIARWHEHAIRMGIVLHVGLHGARAASEPLRLDTAEKAVEIVRWFGRHQLRILSHARRLWLQKQADHLRDLLLTRYPSGISLRDLDVHHSRKADLINRIVAEFSNMFCLENRNSPGPGRRSSPWLKVKEQVRQ